MCVSARHFRLGRQLISQQHNTWSISSTLTYVYCRAVWPNQGVIWWEKFLPIQCQLILESVCMRCFSGHIHFHIAFPPYTVCKENAAAHTTMLAQPAHLNALAAWQCQACGPLAGSPSEFQVGQSISWSVSQLINQFPSLKIVHNCMKRGLNGTLPALLCLLYHVKLDDHRQRRSQCTQTRMQLNWASTQLKTNSTQLKLNSICLAASELNSAQLGNSTRRNSPQLCLRCVCCCWFVFRLLFSVRKRLSKR